MPQFNLELSDNTLRPQDEGSVRAFADRTDWGSLPSSASFHGFILHALLCADVYDSHVVAKGLRLVAALRMALYTDQLTGTPEVRLWRDWLERIDELKNVEDDPAAGLDLAKKELRLSKELIEHATWLLPKNEPASRVLYASGCEIGEAANVRTVSDIGERMQRAQAIAQLAKDSSFDDEYAETPKVSTDAPKKSIEEITEEYNRIHNVPINVTESITHAEFVRGLRDETVGFYPTVGEPIRLVSGIGRVLFNVCWFLYLLAPVLIIPVWAYHERNWWLLLGIIASLIATHLAQLKGSFIGGLLLLASIVFFLTKGLHNYFTFFSFCALWTYFFFQFAEAVQMEHAKKALIDNPELFRRETAAKGLYIWRKRDAPPPHPNDRSV